MLELLLRLGARVPDAAKWGRAYYFKHYDIAAFLLERGMNPNHMNWHRTTLLHDMAWEGDVRKAVLLLDHGADIDAVDDEFRINTVGHCCAMGTTRGRQAAAGPRSRSQQRWRVMGDPIGLGDEKRPLRHRRGAAVSWSSVTRFMGGRL